MCLIYDHVMYDRGCVGERDWFFLLMLVKNYRSANLFACNQFISDLFPWKRTGLHREGGERQSFRAKQGGESKSGCRPGWRAPGQPEAGWPEAQCPGSQECQEHPQPPKRELGLCSEDLDSWWDRRKKLHID